MGDCQAGSGACVTMLHPCVCSHELALTFARYSKYLPGSVGEDLRIRPPGGFSFH